MDKEQKTTKQLEANVRRLKRTIKNLREELRSERYWAKVAARQATQDFAQVQKASSQHFSPRKADEPRFVFGAVFLLEIIYSLRLFLVLL